MNTSHLKEQISLWQLFVLIFLFESGSAVVVGTGAEAKQDAWIAFLFATFLGIGLIQSYVILLKQLPSNNLFDILQVCFGRWISIPFIFIYIIYFFYIATRVVRDFMELLETIVFVKTPIEFLTITMMMLICYILYVGLECLGRLSEIYLPYFLFFIFAITVALFLSGQMNLTNLRPILGDGVTPIMKAVFPQLLTFPFGELVVFMIIIPLVSKFQYVNRVGIFAVIAVGLSTSLTIFVQVATLGAEMRARSNFPLILAAREISLLNFLERVDLVVVFLTMIGIIVKVSVFLYGGLKGLEAIFNIPYRFFCVPVAGMISLFSVLITANYAEHIKEGLDFVPNYMHLPLQFYFPILLFIFLLFKKKSTKSSLGDYK